ncbi:MAG: TonB-dependent receptor [Saprospiraceae bacterium]|nr:TonB-dependent receptor [Saprospiraceae bacterium]MBK9222163.1 TonB-dependent receptor [Saprospiraceae bacterium]MBK9727921.1 TonB-dependent receptor [Saprospiraceae bacterium]
MKINPTNFILFFFLITCVSFSLNAQIMGGMGKPSGPPPEGKIQGEVYDSVTKTPLAFANILIQEALEKKDVDGGLTEDDGKFKIKGLKNAKYNVIVSFLGYQSKVMGPFKINKDVVEYNLGKIYLVSNVNNLEEVTVVGQKDLIENKIDRMVYNADRDVTSKGGNAADVLRKTPLLTVDLEGNVSMRGSSNLKILINGKPSSIMSSSVPDALRMIPADVIEKVEVITNPGAKYDAEGTGGIINIVTKTKKIQGVSGSIYASAGTKSSSLGTNLSVRMGQIGFNANVGGYLWRGKGESNIDRENLLIPINPYFKQTGTSSNIGGGMYGQIGGDYDIDSKNSISLTTRFPLNLFKNTNGLTTFQGDTIGALPFLFRRESDVLNFTFGTDINLDYKKTYGKDTDREFGISAQYSYSNKKSDYETDQFDEVGLLNYNETSPNLGLNKEFTFAADYLHPFSKSINLEVGAKTILRNVYSDIYYDTLNIPANQYLRDHSRDNIFDYDQDVAAAYSQLTFPINTSLKARAGIRYEHTFINGMTDADGNDFKNDYASWIPSGLLAYTLKDKSTLKFSYSRRIQRPSMFYLNPYVNYNDPTNISYGNPELKPELTESFEMSYSLTKDIKNATIAVYHKVTNDLIDNYRFVDTLGRTNSTYNNLATNYSSGMSINGGIMKLGKIILNGTINLYYQKVESSQFDGLQNDAFSYSANGFANVNITPTLGITFWGFVNSPKLTTQGKQNSYFLYSIGLRKDLWKKMGGLTIGVDNPFHPKLNLGSEFKSTSFSYKAENQFEGWGLRVSLDYRFGKMEFGGSQKKRKGNLNDDLKQGEGERGGN